MSKIILMQYLIRTCREEFTLPLHAPKDILLQFTFDDYAATGQAGLVNWADSKTSARNILLLLWRNTPSVALVSVSYFFKFHNNNLYIFCEEDITSIFPKDFPAASFHDRTVKVPSEALLDQACIGPSGDVLQLATFSDLFFSIPVCIIQDFSPRSSKLLAWILQAKRFFGLPLSGHISLFLLFEIRKKSINFYFLALVFCTVFSK